MTENINYNHALIHTTNTKQGQRRRIEKITLYVIHTARTQITNDHSPSWTYIFGLTFSCQAARARVTVATKHQQDSNGCILGATRRLARLILSSRWCRSDVRNDVPGFAVFVADTERPKSGTLENETAEGIANTYRAHRVLSPSHCAIRSTLDLRQRHCDSN